LNKVKARVTKTNSIFLVTVIVAGTFTAIFSLFIIGVEAQPPIPIGEDPEGIAYDPENKRMYVSNTGVDTVSVIDTTTNTVVGSPIRVGNAPSGITYDEQGTKRILLSGIFHVVDPRLYLRASR